jgi:hypothetical protein
MRDNCTLTQFPVYPHTTIAAHTRQQQYPESIQDTLFLLSCAAQNLHSPPTIVAIVPIHHPHFLLTSDTITKLLSSLQLLTYFVGYINLMPTPTSHRSSGPVTPSSLPRRFFTKTFLHHTTKSSSLSPWTPSSSGASSPRSSAGSPSR